MSKPRERWWTYARNVIRAYPELRRQYAELHDLPITRQPRSIIDPDTGNLADFYGSGGNGGEHRQIENAVLRDLRPQDQRELDAVRLALEEIELRPDGRSRLRFVELYHFRRYKLASAAKKAHISEATARRWNGETIYAVAYNLGIWGKDDTHEPN